MAATAESLEHLTADWAGADEAPDEQAVEVRYEAEPTPARFHASLARVRGIMGPIGSGKSVACSVELLAQAMQIPPFKGVRRSRYVAIRNTYPELRTTTIKTFAEWVPDQISTWKFDAPISCVIDFPLPDGTRVLSEVLFLSMDKPKDIKKLKSLDITGFWLNEASELGKGVLDMAIGRLGRFPNKDNGGAGCKFFGIMDTNPPDDDHWWHDLAEVEHPEGFEFFTQPPAVLELADGSWIINPVAENVRNHSKGAAYWLDQIPGKTKNWISVFLQGKYGSVEDGRPVYPEWVPHLHLADHPLRVNESLPLILGWDFGLTPAVVICQLTMNGQFRVLDELVTARAGIKQFARDVVRPFITNKYNGMRIISFGDPSGATSAQDDDERTCFLALGAAGFPVTGTHTNAFIPRREAVVEHMTRLIDGQPGFLLSPNCRYLRRGFNGRYKFRRMQVPGEELYSDSPIKNEVSHPHDALQYAALGASVADLSAHTSTTVGGRSNNWRVP